MPLDREERGESSKEKLKGATNSENPARTLAIRFAKGEISQEEFEMRMTSLRKHGIIK